jgi:hypothetical protein
MVARDERVVMGCSRNGNIALPPIEKARTARSMALIRQATESVPGHVGTRTQVSGFAAFPGVGRRYKKTF